jgi:hypothetical protein
MAQRLKRSFRWSALSIGITEYISNLSHEIRLLFEFDPRVGSSLGAGAFYLLNDHVTITAAGDEPLSIVERQKRKGLRRFGIALFALV